ncbi:DNA primase [Rubrivirga litoralis]|uniref:DNA primase n=1 Tax=Rubrivirga litoralis TaxID=3075598 RepID=A0ABU3BUN1_9BACT|nr:DNA primase [Rubrivirga sp. F394]MDT0633000.1 DNA primase [Rubrivirga sp. F394]
MPAIPDSTIDEVRSASDLVDVVSDRVRLKKQGKNYMGLCPFHNEKSPSFSVDAAQNLYYCFGCRRGGDVFKFVEEIEGVGFLDSVRLLADRAGITIQEEGAGPEADRKGTLLAALRFAAGFYFDQLKTPAGERALAYLKERGFTKEAVVAFGIGAAPDSWDALATAAETAGFKPDVLEAVGLVKSREGGAGGRGGHYDVFRDRLMFPILSPIGKVLGFGGRILPDTRTGSDDYTPAKYVNSPETEVYHKGRVLYGMKQSKRAIRTEREAIVVEGYADVVALWQAGVQNVVAASGTALAPQQMDLLRKLDVQRLVLLFDADAAGRGAARKGVDLALDAGLAPYAVTLPDGADPDSFVRQFGADAFRAFLRDERQDFVAFLVAGAQRDGSLDTPEGKSAAVRDVLATIKRLKDPIQAGEYVRQAASALGVYETDLRRQYDGQAPPRRPAPRLDEEEPAAPPPPVVRVKPEEVSLLRLMLAHGAAMVEHVLTRMGTDEFTEGAPRDAVEAIIAQFEAGQIDPTPFVRGAYGDAVRGLVAEALSERHGLSENWEGKVGVAPKGRDDDPFASATSSMRLLKLDRVQEAVTAAMREIQVRERGGEDIADLQADVNALNELRRQIERDEFLEWPGGAGEEATGDG